MTAKQNEILNYLGTVENATIHTIYDNVSFLYFHNYEHYIGELMSNLIKKGKVIRIKKGLFKIAKPISKPVDFAGTLFG